MRKHYDFSNAVSNPHAEALKDGYTIIVTHKDYDEVITVAKIKKQKNEKNTESATDGAVASTSS